MNKLKERPHLFWLGFAVILLLAESVALSSTWTSFADSERWSDHTHLVLESIESLISGIKDAETGQRGYLLTGNDRYLEPYNIASQSVTAQADELERLTADNSRQQSRIANLQPMIAEKFAELKKTIELKTTGNTAGAIELMVTGEGKQVMDRIRAVLQAMKAEEMSLLKQRSARARSTSRILILVMSSGAGVLFIVLLAGTRAIDRSAAARARAEQAERSHREWLQVTLASIGDGVIASDPSGLVTLINPVATRLTGWSPEEAMNQPVETVFTIRDEETGNTVENPALRAIRDGGIVGLADHTILTARDGRRIPLDDSGAPIIDISGNVLGSVLIFRDASGKKAREAELLRRDRMVRVSFDAIIITDAQRRIQSWNRGAFELYGYDDGEVQNKIIHDLLRTSPPPTEVDEALSHDGQWSGELVQARKDGAAITVESRQVLLRDPEGSIDGILEINRDITERKRAEEAMHRSEARTEFVLEASQLGAWDLDLVSHTAWRSLRHDVVFGYPAPLPEWTYEMFLNHVLSEDREEVDRKFQQAMASGADWQFECRIRRADGTIGWIWAQGRSRSNEKGEPLRMSGIMQDITARKQIEEALRDSEDQFRTLANAIPQLCWMANADGGIFWYNQRWYEYTGTRPEQMEGWGWQSVHDQAVLPQVLERWKASIATGEPFDMVFPLRGAEGVFRDFLTRVMPVRDREGQVTRWFGTNTDISEQRRIEEDLRRSEEQYRTLFNTLLEGFCVVEVIFDSDDRPVDYRFLEINPAFEAQTGLKDARGRLMRELAPAHEAHWFEIYGRVALTGEPARFENEAKALNRWYEVNAYRVGGPQSRKVAILFSDITGRKQAEEARARDAAARYARSLLEASLDPLVTISVDGKITDVNQATELVTGIARERLIGSSFSGYFIEPQLAEEGYRKVLADEIVRDYPLTVRHLSGRTTDVLYNATVYRNEAGQVQGVFAAARDVTERKRAEAELARYRGHLEELVRQRTGELEDANAHLKNATAELARSNLELEQFAYVASHDLQEPLRAVTGYLGLIEQQFSGKLDEEGRRYIAGSVQGAARMHTLITDLLALSRIGTRGRSLEPADLNAVLDQALDSLSVALRESGATVTRDPLPTLRVDAVQIAQLLQNLIGNAIKFRAERPPEIHIGAQARQGQWILAVRDNGIGIEPQYFDRIFLVFQRLHTRRQYPGTGIGLAICKKIVERHGGAIRVESQPGRGSTFYFNIPTEEHHE